jgi:hypothetical protein
VVYASEMPSTEPLKLSKHVSSIPGWFSYQDQFVFDMLLKYQKSNGIQGNLLEIGVYLGKSAIVLGAFKNSNEEVVVCDLFQGVSNSTDNDIENFSSYSDLTRSAFEENYQRCTGDLPRILDGSSLNLWKEFPNHRFRFIHIDGSHLYEFVKSDLNFAIETVISEGGIIVMDDFRAQHTLGVSIALWEAVLAKKLKPIIFSAAKVYLAPFNDVTLDLKVLHKELSQGGYDLESLDVLPNKAIRIMGLSDSDLYNQNSKLTWWVPPVLLPKVRKILSFFGRG